ncbi:phosphoribosylglycinamide formyltransferase [Thiomicrospira sp. ALE5]|uniref:phosphoribosylglycinamide formyltransferase n=1 Tax=Thiomicrospira sp. ALE5 TaxID=748650 RepID=UPI0008EFC2E4|nr:phosphoribosylglycinamide formyltransferase [Thiomicrospira sp. ALE5]SFR58599.1 phosphoribosylglycinamide formyltransferase-1 [Thiomicrospira sp. ALE5]
MAFQIVVLVSGFGSNLQALINQAQQEPDTFSIRAVISNREQVYALERARLANIPSYVISAKPGQTRDDYDQKLSQQLDELQPDLIVMAGFMRILSAKFTDRWQHKLINIHPSLLPKYPGLNTHQRAIDAGDSIHGISIHYVNAEVDGGPIIAQASLNITSNDNAETLAERIHHLEHQLLPAVVTAIASNKIRYNSHAHQVIFNQSQLIQPLSLEMLADLN